MFFWYAFVASAIIGGVATGMSLFRTKAIERTLICGVVLVLVYTGLNWLIFYFGRPIVGFSKLSFYHSFWMWFFEWLIAAVLMMAASANWDSYDFPTPTVGAVLLVVLCFVTLFVTWLGPSSIWTDARAKSLAHTVHVTIEKVGTYPDTDPNHIVIVPVQVARKDASVAMSSDGGNLATQYDLLDPDLQSVDSHAYYVVPMKPASYRTSNQVNGIVPGYIMVDAENPSAPTVIRDKDASGHKIQIHYSLNGSFGHNLERYVWSHGYSGAQLQDWTMEVDDQWRPYWTASINTVTHGWMATVPKGLITVDAQTGKITQYPLNNMPAWVDRVYSADTAKQMMNWWGDYANNPYAIIRRTSTDRYQVHGDPVLVYTKEGYPVWQMELTSINSDSSVAYMALFDGRTDTARLYNIPDVAIESTVVDAIENSNANVHKLTPTHLSMHKIYGHLTWVASLVPQGDGDVGSSAINQGFALLPADEQPNGSHVVIAQSLSQGLSQYQEVLSSTGTAKPGQDSLLTTLKGTVERVSAPIPGPNNTTVYNFSVIGDKHLYAVVYNPASTNPEFGSTLIQPGDKVSFSYTDTGSTLRQVQLFQDLSLGITQ